MVKTELVDLCEDNYFGRDNLECINWACISLIPKVETPKSPSNYRPISLINSTLKIISKILATRLRKVLCSLVDSSQLAFVKGRCIIDNIVMAKELIFSLQKCRILGHILKVKWDFLFNFLEARGLASDGLAGLDLCLSPLRPLSWLMELKVDILDIIVV